MKTKKEVGYKIKLGYIKSQIKRSDRKLLSVIYDTDKDGIVYIIGYRLLK